MKTTCYTYFRITGENFDPELITQALNILPQKQWRTGDKRKNGNTYYDFSSWSSQRISDIDLDLGKQSEAIVDLFDDKIDILHELKETYSLNYFLEVVPTFYLAETTPFFSFSPKVLKFCYLTETSIDLDWYFDYED